MPARPKLGEPQNSWDREQSLQGLPWQEGERLRGLQTGLILRVEGKP